MPLSKTDLDEVLERGEQVFKSLRGERLFVTGGTGFFGRWLLESLTHANQQFGLGLSATILSRNPHSFLERNPHFAAQDCLYWWPGDVRYFDAPPGTFGFVIHAATSASEHLNRTSPLTMFETIVSGTRRVLDFALSANASAMLLASSGAIYGRQPTDVLALEESFPGGPDPASKLSAYAEGKRAAEFLSVASGLPVKIARGFAFAGPYLPMDTHFAFGNFIRDANCGKCLEIRGDGTPLRSYLYAGDLVVWLLTILVNGRAGRPYNVGSDEVTSIHELAHAIAGVAGGHRVRVLQQPTGAPPERYIPSIARARSELALETWTSLQESIRRTLAWTKTEFIYD